MWTNTISNYQVSFDDKGDSPKGDAEIVGILKNGSSNITPTTPSPIGNDSDNKYDTDVLEDKPLVNGIKGSYENSSSKIYLTST